MNLPGHVLMTTDTVGGVWSWSVQWAELLAVAGVRVTLAAFGEPPTAVDVPGVDVVHSSFRLEWMEDPWEDVDAAGQWLLRIEAERQPDLVHLNDYSHGALPLTAPKVVVAHSDVLSWWDSVIGGPVPVKWNTYRRRVRAGLLGADMTVAVSGSLATSIESAYGVDRPLVIYNGRDASDWMPGLKRDIVFSSGRVWDDAKNIRGLDAASLGLPWPVLVAGALESPEGHRAELQHAKSVGTATASQMREWFGGASIYALPARYEPFGLSVLEAALSDCALVLGDIPSLRELWSGCALFVPPGNTAELHAALMNLIESPGRRQALATCARERARNYNIERMKSAWLEAYQLAADRAALHRGGTPACTS